MSGYEHPARYCLDLTPGREAGYRWDVYNITAGGLLRLDEGWSLTRRGAIRRAQRIVDRHDRRTAKAARTPREYLWPRGDGE